MPPKEIISKDDIINSAFKILKGQGKSFISARNIAKELNCSVKPIFRIFKNMEELNNEVFKKAYSLYESYLSDNNYYKTLPFYKAIGMNYIRFAKEEKNVYKLIFMEERQNKQMINRNDFGEIIDVLSEYLNISKEKAFKFQKNMWFYIHGIACMHVNMFMNLSDEEIAQYLSEEFHALVKLYKEEKENG